MTRSGIVRALCTTSRVRAPQAPYRRGADQVPCVLSFKICPRVPGGFRQGSRRALVRQFTGLIRVLFLASARVIFKLELKVTRVPCGTAK